ncbi:MAG: glycosyltransferase family 2 protein [Patescibacteria group bacterium]|nr:glycosyltransferase family 2 protein [Patescibacteria group bacterium]
MTLSIIIPSYNTKDLLKKCLDSVRQLADEIIVVDNGSIDGSAKMIDASFPNVVLIENTQNLGFAKAINKGVKKASGKFVFLLNSDTVVRKDALAKAFGFLARNPDSIIGLGLVNPDGSIQSSVYHFPTIWRAIKEFWFGIENSYQKYTPKGEDAKRVDAVTGAAMIVSKDVFEKLNGFDEKYFFYFEDLDFCRKASKKGISVYYLPFAKILHHHGASGVDMPKIVHNWLVASSKKYNGNLKYYLITLIILLGQKWQRLIGKN